MAMPYVSVWSSINTLFEIGLEIYRLMAKDGGIKAADKNTSVEKIADGVLLMSNDKEILLAVSKDTAHRALSEAAISRGAEKGEYLCYSGAATAIPLFDLSRVNEAVREHIISEESLRATLCVKYPEYVKTYNINAAPDAQIKDADAPTSLFLQKQLDHAADSTRAEVAEYQAAHARETAFERQPHEDLELER